MITLYKTGIVLLLMFFALSANAQRKVKINLEKDITSYLVDHQNDKYYTTESVDIGRQMEFNN